MKHTHDIQHILHERILVIDGAMGTVLQEAKLSANDFGGAELEGCNENLVLTRPDVITNVHAQYLEAGADIIETNTFGGTEIVLAEYNLQDKAGIINETAARLACEVAKKYSTTAKPRFVAGSIGPTTKSITVTGGTTFSELVHNFKEQTKALLKGGVDLLLIETCQDTRNIKAAVIGAHEAFQLYGKSLPIMISGTIEPMGTMLAGQDAEALVASLEHVDLLSIGLNCATGPDLMADHIRTMHEMSTRFVSCYPNAGLPNEEGLYTETPDSLADKLDRFVKNGWVNILGGCCGTTPAHIRAISDMVACQKPRNIFLKKKARTFFSGIESIESNESNRPLIVGERTNVIGSRLFKQLVTDSKWEEATDIAKRQINNGAQIIDVCIQTTDLDEADLIDPFYDKLIRKIKVPVMIDTTDATAIEKALTYLQGKSIINSINLEDGEEKFQKICPIARKYGAALVVGCIDEDPVQAQAFTRERKLAVAQRSFDLLTQKYGFASENIIFDPLVFPCATGDANYIGGAVETIEGIRLIKEAFPDCKTVLGISNISFGLPAAAREVVNSVFLYHCTKAGLDLAIVNAEKLERFAEISEEEKELAENLLFNFPALPHRTSPYKGEGTHSTSPFCKGRLRGVEHSSDWRQQSESERIAINQANIAAIASHFRNTVKKEKKSEAALPLDTRLAHYIISGSKDGLIADLELKRQEGASPLDIINGPLMSGMAEVGRLFNNNELIVAEVLQSAEAMKTAVDYLEQFMTKSESVSRGKIILATVKGDVHDIGKNLVEIIFKNNGFHVINLGIKVHPEQIIQAYQEYKPDLIGLSGLLVKSAHQMVTTASDLKAAGVNAPILVGGAALSERFTKTKILAEYSGGVFYAKDAMSGLSTANQLMDMEERQLLLSGLYVNEALPEEGVKEIPEETYLRSEKVQSDIPIPPVLDHSRQIENYTPDIDAIWNYINPQMLYAKHLGFRGNFDKKLAEKDPKAVQLYQHVCEVKEVARRFMKIRGVWQFFEAESVKNSIFVFQNGEATPFHVFTFNRQRKENGLCLSDYVLPKSPLQRDNIALFVVTAGDDIQRRSEELKEKGAYLHCHILQALALETAEATAEWLHQKIRMAWGFSDPKEMSPLDLFTTKYRGKRYSFGYPACPNLDDQAGIWKLLSPQDIGVELTEGMMMSPEASVSAIVFHHPDCSYFSVGSSL